MYIVDRPVRCPGQLFPCLARIRATEDNATVARDKKVIVIETINGHKVIGSHTVNACPAHPVVFRPQHGTGITDHEAFLAAGETQGLYRVTLGQGVDPGDL
jgi:hypothetical protein